MLAQACCYTASAFIKAILVTINLSTLESEGNAFKAIFTFLLREFSSTFSFNLPNGTHFNTDPHILLTLNIKLFHVLLPNCNFPTVMNVNIRYARYLR